MGNCLRCRDVEKEDMGVGRGQTVTRNLCEARCRNRSSRAVVGHLHDNGAVSSRNAERESPAICYVLQVSVDADGV